MKRTVTLTSLLLTFVMTVMTFIVVSVLYAQDSFSIPVTCVIPAVPGLNAPALIQETTPVNSSQEQNTATINQTTNNAPSLIQTDTNKEIILAQGETTQITVTTLYSR